MKKLPLTVAAPLEPRSPNTMEISRVLPLEPENIQTREQWLRWLLKNRLVMSPEMCEPFGRQVLAQAAQGGQTICLSMDQTEVGNRLRF